MMTVIYMFVYFLLLLHITGGANNLNLTSTPRHVAYSILYPYHVAIIRNRDTKKNCGGALIEKKFVLTAAACIPSGDIIEVVLGASDLFVQDMNQISVSIRSIQIHFDEKKEIALIKLHDNLRLPAMVRPVHVAEVEDDFSTGDTGIITGWDKETRMSANVVKKLDHESCKRSFWQIEESDICVVETPKTKENHYVGHSSIGNPVINPKNKKLVGIVSSDKWVFPSHQIKLFRISSYIDWIHVKLQDLRETTHRHRTE